ncbi:tripartite tricarboxylate transporter substrate binding protein [Ottowia sp. GY511]|uniref:Bug family tripartite tricarboxylate transporter substrate binding protein n=1 Tax=Ottowia flava TaxID=2675430 RepID=A0ABW4KWM7_9BURK|nr:tripartite tricarboxylate transporter substrate binding protein [Ottowia sp. GY511]TXK25006.1 tripartite tricarboxylate transporter substrate binding protein [Ottowia sp. GY511]
MHRRQLLAAAALTAYLPAVWAAKGYPNKAIRIVVPNAPGGAADITARAVGEHMTKTLGQPIVIENKPGAGGVVAGQTVASAAPDGYTLLLISSGTAVSEALFKSLPFDTLKAFAPVAPLATFDLVIVGAENGRFATLGDLVGYARQNPGKVNLGTPNLGTTQHLAAELFKSAAGIDLQVVPFKSTPDVITALRSGQIDAGLDILSPLLAQIQGKALKPLAVTGPKRSRVLPDVPTAQEAGVKGLNAASWNGLAVPAKTPADVIARLNKAVNAALADEGVRKKLETLNLDPHPGTPTEAAQMLRGDIQRWNAVIDKAHVARQ